MKNQLVSAIFLFSGCLNAWAIDIPSRAADWAQQSAIQAAKLVATSDTRIVAYFDANGRHVKHPTRGGFYRALIGRTADGKAIIQDYYQDVSRKKIDPVILNDASQMGNFDALITTGIMTWYTPTGEAVSFMELENGQIRQKATFENGYLVFNQERKNQRNITQFFYPNGKKMLQIELVNGQTQHSISYDEQGNVIADSMQNYQSANDNLQMKKIEQRANGILQRMMSKSIGE